MKGAWEWRRTLSRPKKKYFALAARENVPGAAEGLERLSGQPAAKRFPATSLRITGVFLLGLAAFLGIGAMGWRTLGAAVQRGVHSVLHRKLCVHPSG